MRPYERCAARQHIIRGAGHQQPSVDSTRCFRCGTGAEHRWPGIRHGERKRRTYEDDDQGAGEHIYADAGTGERSFDVGRRPEEALTPRRSAEGALVRNAVSPRPDLGRPASAL